MTLPPIEIDPKTFLHRHCTLPALPAIVTRIQDVILSENVSINKIADLISNDPGLVAQILKIVNSAYYSFPREVVDIHLAVAYLGINEVYRTVLSVAVIKTLKIQDKAAFGKIWHHSVYTALCARYLAHKFEPLLQPGEIWTAAILHDVGRLIYLKFFPGHYKILIEYCHKQGCLFAEAEEHFSLPPSSYLGTLLCDHWRLPNLIRDVCGAHDADDLQHLADENSHEAFLKIIISANSLTLLATEKLNAYTKNRIAKAVQSSLKCTEKEFMVMMGDIYELRLEVEKFL